MRIAVDVDGVLADHVSAVLSRLHTEHECFDRTKQSMCHWDEELPTLDTSLKTEIESAESDPRFVLNIEPVKGAAEATTILMNENHELGIVTARSKKIRPETREWLEANDIAYNPGELLFTEGRSKTVSNTDILIDDFPGHVSDFAKDGKYAILFVQPWNKSQVDTLTESPQVFSAEDWNEVVEIIRNISTKSET
ncbi:5' nucleotidase, NT5C type [Haloarcula marismortui]|jgi:5'(3')-deoxyribonucleotidase|uniref:5' nucleotidase, NT5C type n=1 Tax=Haloarcula marismortui TaxID=2238 RepID=UPI0009B59952|nr:hypothetical protein [Haloarcula californiae]